MDVFENATGTQLSVDKGVYVVEVSKDSPASKAGLSAGDVITGIDAREIRTMGQLVRHLYQYRSRDQISIKILRNGEEKKLKVVLEKVPQND